VTGLRLSVSYPRGLRRNCVEKRKKKELAPQKVRNLETIDQPYSLSGRGRGGEIKGGDYRFECAVAAGRGGWASETIRWGKRGAKRRGFAAKAHNTPNTKRGEGKKVGDPFCRKKIHILL